MPKSSSLGYERLAVEVLHHVVLAAVLERAEREHVDDVIDGEPAPEHLDGDHLADQRVDRLEHLAERPLAE